ncbi:Molybdenum cofactor sulfurase [Bienertia sinuspersici]
MQSPSTREVTQLCFHGCCPTPLFTLNEADKSSIAKPRNSSSENRRTFASTTSSSLYPNTEFNNPDSLPSLQEAFSQFIRTYPNYSETYQIDEVRAREYYNLSLSNHVCLDYIGIGLFSFSQLHNQLSFSYPSTSSSPPPLPPHSSDFPVFHLSYKSVNLKNQLLEGGNESKLESAIKKRIRDFLNISEDDYSVVLTANRTSAFRLVAESYPFGSCKKLLTVYDHDSEAIDTMINSSEKRGAQAMAAEFSWPRLRIQSSKLRSMITSKSMICKKRGLFVFQLQSRVTGARYSYQWMKVAQEQGWHVLLDACAVGPKDMDSLGLSLFQPDFLVCSFYKVFGENPSGFGCLFVKKSTIPILETSTAAGIVSIVSARKLFYLTDESSGTETEAEQEVELGSSSSNSFSGPIHAQAPRMEKGESSTSVRTKGSSLKINGAKLSEIEVIEETSDIIIGRRNTRISTKKNSSVECRCLDHIDSLGLSLVNSRSRYLVNWLINGLTKLQHPNADKAVPLVKIYGPKVKFDRGPALAFNVFDWKGEKVEPILIQKLADRKSISLSYGFLHHIWFPEKYEHTKARVLEKRRIEAKESSGNKRKEKEHLGIRVVTAAFGFIANFADAYRLWVFIAQFLDADFVEKERWRYTALNQKTLEI